MSYRAVLPGSTVRVSGRAYVVATNALPEGPLVLRDDSGEYPGQPDPDGPVWVLSAPRGMMPDYWTTTTTQGSAQEVLADLVTLLMPLLVANEPVRVTIERVTHE